MNTSLSCHTKKISLLLPDCTTSNLLSELASFVELRVTLATFGPQNCFYSKWKEPLINNMMWWQN